MRPACARDGCIKYGVVAIPHGHGKTAGWVRLCEPHFEEWLTALRVRHRYPCAISGCLNDEHLDGLCEPHWVTLRGADEPGTPSASTVLRRFAVRHLKQLQVADAPSVEHVQSAIRDARTLEDLARAVARKAASAAAEVYADLDEAAVLLHGAVQRLRALGMVEVREAPTATPPKKPTPATTPSPQGSLFGLHASSARRSP